MVILKPEDKTRATREGTLAPVPADFKDWPRGQEALLRFYGDKAAYSSPEAYWALHGKFVHLPEDFKAVKNIGTRLGFWAHAKCVASLERIFREIRDAGLISAIKSFDGCYNHRTIRGGKLLSMHAFGAAVDLNAATNQLGAKGDMSHAVVQIFKKHGWTWGGDWRSRPDGMHFELGGY